MTSDEERVKIAEFMQDVYDVRSIIAHGEAIEGNKKYKNLMKKYENIENVLNRLEEYVRKSINAYLQMSKKNGKKEIMCELDKSLLSIESREKLQLAKN